MNRCVTISTLMFISHMIITFQCVSFQELPSDILQYISSSQEIDLDGIFRMLGIVDDEVRFL